MDTILYSSLISHHDIIFSLYLNSTGMFISASEDKTGLLGVIEEKIARATMIPRNHGEVTSPIKLSLSLSLCWEGILKILSICFTKTFSLMFNCFINRFFEFLSLIKSVIILFFFVAKLTSCPVLLQCKFLFTLGEENRFFAQGGRWKSFFACVTGL